MKIAVTYENGQVFQHFGHTAQFKLYDVENGAVVWNNGMTDEEVAAMTAYARRFQEVNDAILDTDYYSMLE